MIRFFRYGKAQAGFLALVATAAFETEADAQASAEADPAACGDRVDNDRDGYVDCQDQDCHRFPACVPYAPTVAPVVVGSRGAGWSRAGAIVGLTMMAPLLGLGIASEVTLDEGLLPSIALGGGALATFLIGAPIAAVAASSGRRRAGVRGCLGCFIAGWVTFGLAVADGASLIGVGAAGADIPHGLIASTVALGVVSLTLFSTDGLVVAAQARRAARGDSGEESGRLAIAPFVAPVTDERTMSGAVVGVAWVR